MGPVMGPNRAARAGPELCMGQGDMRAAGEGHELVLVPLGIDATQW